MQTECYICGGPVSLDTTMDAEQISDKKGFVYYFHCLACGAQYEVYGPEGQDNDKK